MTRTLAVFAPLLMLMVSTATAEPVTLRVGEVTYAVDPTTLKVDAKPDGAANVAVLPPLQAPRPVTATREDKGWRWTDAEGRTVAVSVESEALRLTITGAKVRA